MGLEESIKDGGFIIDFIHLLHFKCHKINLDRGGLYIDSPNWLKNKKKTSINPMKKHYNKCSQYLH